MKKVLIIGGGSGIGFEIAKTLNSNNYDVACVGRKERENFEFKYVKCDVSKDDVKKIYETNVYDVLIFCAGIISSEEESFSYNEDEINNLVDTNLKGCIRCNQLFIDSCLKNSISGKIINISSISNKGSKYFPIYAATKAGILTYTKSVASRYENIQANVISPGVIKTDMSYHETPNFDEYIPSIIENTSVKRLGSTTDIANTVEFLLSDKSSYITGQEIVVDGGYTLPKE
ncbi:MAG: SDR family oxidoreductase [Clostridia bacterium]|nr:SDR family oxidoreductase [Clostridia bacterium]